MRVVYLSRAKADLRAVFVYTLGRWDADQADCYLQALEEEIAKLARFPHLGRPSPYAEGMRLLPVQEHVVHYRVDGKRVLIVTVRHARQRI